MRTMASELYRGRRSIRQFQPKPVPRELLMRLADAARLAPSATNVQPWRFIIIDDPKLKEAFSGAAFSGIYSQTKFAARAPVLILVLSKPAIVANRIGKQIQGIAFHLIDIGIAGEHLVLAAQEQGLGTCWIGWFNPRRVRKFFKIPRSYKPIVVIAMGYPEKTELRPKARKELRDIAWFNAFGAS